MPRIPAHVLSCLLCKPCKGNQDLTQSASFSPLSSVDIQIFQYFKRIFGPCFFYFWSAPNTFPSGCMKQSNILKGASTIAVALRGRAQAL